MDLFEKMFIGLLSASTKRRFGELLTINLKGPMKFVSLNNQSCQTRLILVNINSDETIFYSFVVSFKKSNGSCNVIGYLYARVCYPNRVQKISM